MIPELLAANHQMAIERLGVPEVDYQ